MKYDVFIVVLFTLLLIAILLPGCAASSMGRTSTVPLVYEYQKTGDTCTIKEFSGVTKQ